MTFPPYLWIGEVAVRHKGDGYYFRDAGAHGIYLKEGAFGELTIAVDENDPEMVEWLREAKRRPATEAEWRADNHGYVRP